MVTQSCAPREALDTQFRQSGSARNCYTSRMLRQRLVPSRPVFGAFHVLCAQVSLALPLSLLGCADIEDPLPPPEIEWSECEGTDLVECGTLTVPRDYDDPYGPTFDLPVVRRPAADPSARIGSIVFNPGGPGGSGAQFAALAWLIVPPVLRDRFDLVGFDPRGEAASTPVIACLDDPTPFVALDPTPDSGAEREAILRESKALAEGCAERSGDLLRFIGTNSIVRDMDQLREALGEEKLTYVGFSYGTFLGAIYADTFPERTRALVLDAVVDPALTAEQMIYGQALGFEGELSAFFDKCGADETCAFYSDGDPAAAYDLIQAAVETSPLPAPPGGDRALGPGEFSYGVAAALYRPSGWKNLAQALAKARDGDGSGLLSLADGYLDRRDDGTYSNGLDVYYAVTSVDTSSSRDPEILFAVAEEAKKNAPRIGAYLPNSSMPSLFWPVAPWRKAGPVTAKGAPPILIVGGTNDPATPYSNAVALSKQLPGSVLLTRDAHGHTSFLAGSSCIDDAVSDYLVDLALPEADKVCSD